MATRKALFVGLLGGIVGIAISLCALHLYTDHVALHTMLDFLNTHAAKISKLP